MLPSPKFPVGTRVVWGESAQRYFKSLKNGPVSEADRPPILRVSEIRHGHGGWCVEAQVPTTGPIRHFIRMVHEGYYISARAFSAQETKLLKAVVATALNA